jgi:Kef-type K+ transport system membrane component KefB
MQWAERWRSWRLGVVVTGGVLAGSLTVAAVRHSPGETVLPLVDPLARFLLAVAVILLVCHLLGSVLAAWGQPRVVGEILGGLLLGPSGLGAVWAGGRDWLFPTEVVTVVRLAAELGLVVFMFLLGCELPLQLVRRHRAVVTWVVTGATGLPLLAGAGVAWAGHDLIAGPAHSMPLHIGFFALAMSITAVPVLARILADLRLTRTPVGTLALTCAAAGDGVTWAALAVLFGLAGSGGDPVGTIALAVALVAATVGIIRPGLAAVFRRWEASPAQLLPVLVAGLLGFAALAQLVGLHPVLGGFLFGLVLPRQPAVLAQVEGHLRGFAVTVLLPLFFAGIGLHAAIGTLGSSAEAWGLLVAVLLVAIGGKLVGGAGAARLAGLPGRDALRVGALLNCRGVTELVVAAAGFQLQLVSSRGLTLLVLMALVTTALTGPLVRLAGLAEHRRPGRRRAGRPAAGHPPAGHPPTEQPPAGQPPAGQAHSPAGLTGPGPGEGRPSGR